MKLIDKLLLGFVSILMICVCLALIAAAIGFPLTQAVLESTVASLQKPVVALIVCLFALAVCAAAIRIMIAVFGKDARAKKNVQVYQSESGTSYVTVHALGSMVQRYVQTDERVREAKCSVKAHNGSASIMARIAAKPGVAIPEMTEQLQNSIKSHIETYSGATVENVQVIIESTEADSTHARVS